VWPPLTEESLYSPHRRVFAAGMRREVALTALTITIPAWVIAALLMLSWFRDTHETCGSDPLWAGPLIVLVPLFGLAALATALAGDRRGSARTALGNAAYLSSSLAIVWSIWFFVHTFTIELCGF
jgi:EamA domain-containing membrane protein RarD